MTPVKKHQKFILRSFWNTALLVLPPSWSSNSHASTALPFANGNNATSSSNFPSKQSLTSKQQLAGFSAMAFLVKHRSLADRMLLGVLMLFCWGCCIYYFLKRKEMQQNSLLNQKTANLPIPDNIWWRDRQFTVWSVWIGKSEIPPVIRAAIDSCEQVHHDEPNLHYRVVTDEDVIDSETRLGFALHPSFWLLDEVEQSDYLRAELLHFHGGFYMDADIVCMQSLSSVLEKSPFDAAGAQDRTHYGPWPSLSENALGPFRPESPITTHWHNGLHKTMDKLTPQLQECSKKYNGKIPYPRPRHHGVSICGITWGGVIDFIRPVWKSLALNGRLGHDLKMCDLSGEHVGWDGNEDMSGRFCHILHLGTAGNFFYKRKWTLSDLCKKAKVLRHSKVCNSNSTLIPP